MGPVARSGRGSEDEGKQVQRSSQDRGFGRREMDAYIAHVCLYSQKADDGRWTKPMDAFTRSEGEKGRVQGGAARRLPMTPINSSDSRAAWVLCMVAKHK